MSEKRFFKSHYTEHIIDKANDKCYPIRNVMGVDDLVDLLNSLSEENEKLRQIIKDIVCATDETYKKNTSMFKVTVVFDGKMYNQIRSCLYE